MKKYRKRKILIAIIALLIIFRLFLPVIVKNYLNNVLAELPGYTGAVENVDIALIRGAYVIKGMHLSVMDAGTEIPFINLPETDISVEWKSLFKGSIVSEIIMNDPEIIYIMEDQEDTEGAVQEDWTKALTDIVPLDINHFEIHSGKISLVMLSADPNIDLTMEKVELTADNLSNVIAARGTLPSTFEINANTFGEGTLSMNGNLNLLKEVPDMDISFKLENSKVTALNDLTRHYGKLDFASGMFNIYGEMAIADSYLKGYVKPFIKNSELIDSEDGFLETVWEGFIGFFKFILKNQKTDSVAMKVQFEGDLSNVETGVWSTVGSIIKNAWIKAFVNNVDNSIEFQDAFQDRKDARKTEKPN
ncbi:DUF748 domain-containing protein [Arcticibacterium luteifluviistationis]|uniref:DUF748 domain-containing protein n=1 Tax=Arcticibacterium luteifluviistationis TaxID=1784714 RepID=A0A2Z4G7G0_9BACT|nr:DUF748 domain-containing protein [Arcticibacterium luteifluviistationis]AWV97087.1 hypothetical protein DJ013_02405 [Arcticibacterium luteifluviistationis]